MTASIFWYDYETTGIDPRRDRPMQVAGLRTDEQLNIVAPPLNLYCRLSDDILPHPAACLITGITPARLADSGLGEAEFMARMHAELARPGTCGAGYNSLRFDDEVTRYSLYRNFYDPYAREWQGGNSRWDLIDVVRTAYALRPEGIEWPLVDGRPSLRLELLTAANALEHGQAHDALSDVHATIALARLIRDRQPRLYAYLYGQRAKARLLEQIQLLRPMLHVSGRFAAERSYLAVVLPLAWHPRNRNALIVCDLQADCGPLLEETAEVLRQRLYTRRDALLPGERAVPLKLVHVNRSPVLLPLNVLRQEDQLRLGIDLPDCLKRAALLRELLVDWQDKLPLIYQEEAFTECEDPEQQLYSGFIGDRDRRLCERVRTTPGPQLAEQAWPFDDARLPELLFRYRARNFPATLSAEERERWRVFCCNRLCDPTFGAPNTLAAFDSALAEYCGNALPEQLPLLNAWAEYAAQLRVRLDCSRVSGA